MVQKTRYGTIISGIPKHYIFTIWKETKLNHIGHIVHLRNIFLQNILLEKGRGLSFGQIWVPITQGFFVSSLIAMGPAVLEMKIFKCQFFFGYVLRSPFDRERSHLFEQFVSSSPKNALCLVWLKLAQWSLRRSFLKFIFDIWLVSRATFFNKRSFTIL